MEKIIYKIYARKSSEAEDRQMLSIDSQISEDKKLVIQRGIEIGDDLVISESKSAKNPYERPAFEQLIKNIESGKVKGIIAWHPNRLSRNAIDAARLVDLFDRGKLIEIITSQQTFKNTPSDKFFFSMLCSQAKMENDNKSLDVKRGLRKKCEMGYPPNLCKTGYKNDGDKKGEKYWVKDPERFELVKQLLEKYLRERISVRDLLKYSDEALGLKSIQRKKVGGKPLKLSILYKMLKDPFYAGFFYAKGENGERVRYEVNESVPRMITEEQYWKIQEKLGEKTHPRERTCKDKFVYKKYARCGSCGGPITAHYKHQLICSECKYKFSYPHRTNCPKCGVKIKGMRKPKYLEYIYYVCTKRCTKQKNPQLAEPSLRETEIDKQIAAYFENNLQISPDLRDWCIQHLDEPEELDQQNEFEIRASWERQLQKKKKELDELKLMRARRMIENDEELSRLQAPIKADIKKAEDALAGLGREGDKEKIEKAKRYFNLAVGIAEIFKSGTFEEKEMALIESCSNLTINGKITTILEKKELSIIKKFLCGVKEKNKEFEPKKFVNFPNKITKNRAFGPALTPELRW